MSNPLVIESPRVPADLFSCLDYHSTTGPALSKFSFRDTSVALVESEHNRILQVYKYIHDCGGHDLRTQYERCRTDAWVMQHEVNQTFRVASRKCNQRWCPMCAKTKRWIITNSVAEWGHKIKQPKFLTLTLKSTSDKLEVQVQRLYDSFKKIRKRPFWKKAVKGGVWFFQLTMNKRTQLWHPHLHILLDGEYISKRRIRTAWKEITLDSMIVDIKKVTDVESAAEYIARYASAPVDLLTCTISQGADAVVGLKGRRMCGSFGSAKGIALRAKKMDEVNPWRKVMSYQAMRVGASFDPYIKMIQDAFAAGKPFDADVWGLYDTPSVPVESLKFKPESAQMLLFEYQSDFYSYGVH